MERKFRSGWVCPRALAVASMKGCLLLIVKHDLRSLSGDEFHGGVVDADLDPEDFSSGIQDGIADLDNPFDRVHPLSGADRGDGADRNLAQMLGVDVRGDVDLSGDHEFGEFLESLDGFSRVALEVYV